MKYCPRCGIEKDASEFYLNRSKRDGLSSYCKVCKQSMQRDRYHGVYKLASKQAPLYTAQDLAIRASLGLWEHVFEMLTLEQLADAWGVSRSTAAVIRSDPNRLYPFSRGTPTHMQGTAYFSDERKRLLIRYLEVEHD